MTVKDLQKPQLLVSGGSMLGKLGLPELLILLAIVFFLFGAKRLPEIGKGIGEGIKGFKDAMRKDEKDLQETKQKEV